MLLMTGAILCKGGRTVCGALKVMGLRGEQAFETITVFSNRDSMECIGGGQNIAFANHQGVGHHRTRHCARRSRGTRSGEKIKNKGCYRMQSDPAAGLLSDALD